ncbi:MAG TPA: hypothetical protein VMW50_13360 [Dehalococcoidia bacterium]|nr:hypothetical protein [Dehalococcoidia bacterium]
MPRGEEGPGWSEYVMPALRPTRVMAERELGFIVERAVANFLREHSPIYRRKDITGILIDEEPLGGGLVNYRAKVAYTEVVEDQI